MEEQLDVRERLEPPPKRDFVFRYALRDRSDRPRSSVYRWRIRSASPNRNDRSTTASVLTVRPTASVGVCYGRCSPAVRNTVNA